MEQSNNLINERMDTKDVNINIAPVPDWNWLFIDDLDPEYDNEFHNFISDDDVACADWEQNKEEPTHTPEMFDWYIDMDIGLSRGVDG